MTIDIIGAGIGGLTTALALKRHGISTRLYEQASVIKPVGAGIILANNAMQVYDKLGLRQQIEQNGNRISSMNITKADLRPINAVDLSYFERKHQVGNVAIHRAALQEILLEHCDVDTLHLDARLDQISKEGLSYLLQFKDGSIVQSEAIIGADGIHSHVRPSVILTSPIRLAKQLCWRGVTNFRLPKAYRHVLIEAWGKKDRFGFVQIAPDTVYWYALKSYRESPNALHLDQLSDYFKDYDPLVLDVIQSTNSERIHCAEMGDFKPIERWCQGNICLMGDAAHAMTPNMGQGACQAIEDAYILAECLNQKSTSAAFEQFQSLRLSKAKKMVQMSWSIGQISHLSNPLFISLRNFIFRNMPASANRRRLEQIFEIPVL